MCDSLGFYQQTDQPASYYLSLSLVSHSQSECLLTVSTLVTQLYQKLKALYHIVKQKSQNVSLRTSFDITYSIPLILTDEKTELQRALTKCLVFRAFSPSTPYSHPKISSCVYTFIQHFPPPYISSP